MRLGYAYYYCHYTHQDDEASSLLRWIVGQLSRQTTDAPQQIKYLRDNGREPTEYELLQVLETLLDQFDIVYLIIDGVDESVPRVQLLSVLVTLATNSRFDKIRLLSTSRLVPDIENALLPISASISMSNHFVEQDIQRTVAAWTVESPHMAKWRYMATYIESKICNQSDGMYVTISLSLLINVFQNSSKTNALIDRFRWVACQMQIVERIREETQLIDALNSLPPTIDDIYLRILLAIPQPDRAFVRQALLWIAGHSASGRLHDKGIHIDVLVSAVCDDLLRSTGKRYLYTADDLQELCSCLITVTAEPLPFTDFLSDVSINQRTGEAFWTHRYLESEAPIGRFVKIAHYTVIEFLVSDRIRSTAAKSFSLSWPEITNEFFNSVLEQSLAADPTAESADWVRDREPYCLTLLPLIIPNSLDDLDDATVDRCIAYFLPSSPHFPRLRRIQYYLCGGCPSAQAFHMARLPVYHPGLPPSTYERNDPYVWALLGMRATGCFELSVALKMKLGWDPSTIATRQINFGMLGEVSLGLESTVCINSFTEARC